MLLVGLTGSIGMGKSETTKMFAAQGVPTYDADAAVHTLYAAGGAAVEPIGEAFPGVIKDGAIDREELGKRVLVAADELKRLEKIIHPLVGLSQLDFLQNAEKSGASMVVLDIPLLFETGGEARVDVSVVVSAPADLQRQRVLARPGMSAQKFESILAKQVPDAQKREKADFIVDSSQGLDPAMDDVKRIIETLQGREGKIWATRKAAL